MGRASIASCWFTLHQQILQNPHDQQPQTALLGIRRSAPTRVVTLSVGKATPESCCVRVIHQLLIPKIVHGWLVAQPHAPCPSCRFSLPTENLRLLALFLDGLARTKSNL